MYKKTVNYHFRNGECSYGIVHFYAWFTHHKPRKKYVLTEKQFSNLMNAVFDSVVEELYKDNDVHIPFIGKLSMYQYELTPVIVDGEVQTNNIPINRFYKKFGTLKWRFNTCKYSFKYALKFIPDVWLVRKLSKKIRNNDVHIKKLCANKKYFNYG
jgi:hypothetical protein